MNKQTNIQKIEIRNLNMSSVIEGICQSNGILFITEQGKLIGAMTEGDIRRFIKCGYHNLDETMFNHKVTYITECDNMSVIYSEAGIIFENHPKIYNIPVVDETGNLLYQIDKTDNVMYEHIKESLYKIRKFKPINILLECHKAKHIVLTGGNLEILNVVKNCLDEELDQSGAGGSVDVSLYINITECQNCPEDTIIICLSDIIVNYLKKISYNTKSIIPIKEIPNYYFYKKLNNIQLETITNFVELFGYNKISIHNRNKYINKIISGMETCNVIVSNEDEIFNEGLYITDICAYSVHNKYKERISLEIFSTILQTIQEYNYVTNMPLSRERYIQEYIDCLISLKSNDIRGIIFKVYNFLDYEVLKAVKKLKWLHVIKQEQEKDMSIKWLDVTKEPRGGEEDIFLELRYWCMHTALINASYDLVCNYCNNVYACRLPWDMREYDKYFNMERIIENYAKNNGYFPSNFSEIMYGEKEFPVEQLLKDIKGCAAVYVNDGYMKYQSNYKSNFFNTDIYGNRVTKDMPKVYSGTIWLIGTCIFSGYAVSDDETVASVIQKKINKLGMNYRIVNLSLGGGNFRNQVDRICEEKIGIHDIVIYWVNFWWNRENTENVITINIDKLLNELGTDCYWDTPLHCGLKGNNILAEQILEEIKPKLIQVPKREFHLEYDLEKEIAVFVNGIIKLSKENPICSSLKNMSVKSGAVVMNCNPFTYGHQYLIETVSRLVDILYIFVVEENKSIFDFEDRLHMVKDGVKKFPNVVVLPSGKFMISSITFPGYFMKDNPDNGCYDSFLDLRIFAYYIAPALGISKRFVGEEPFDKVTAQYNNDMKIILASQDIDVIEIPRKKLGSEVISATKVRELLRTKKYDLLENYIPETTINYLKYK